MRMPRSGGAVLTVAAPEKLRKQFQQAAAPIPGRSRGGDAPDA